MWTRRPGLTAEGAQGWGAARCSGFGSWLFHREVVGPVTPAVSQGSVLRCSPRYLMQSALSQGIGGPAQIARTRKHMLQGSPHAPNLWWKAGLRSYLCVTPRPTPSHSCHRRPPTRGPPSQRLTCLSDGTLLRRKELGMWRAGHRVAVSLLPPHPPPCSSRPPNDDILALPSHSVNDKVLEFLVLDSGRFLAHDG